MTRTKEEQVEAAYRDYARSSAGFQNVAHKLLDGYYAEEELPKILSAGAAWNEPELVQWVKKDYWVVRALDRAALDDWGQIRGPMRKTKLAAILAWNAGMERG